MSSFDCVPEDKFSNGKFCPYCGQLNITQLSDKEMAAGVLAKHFPPDQVSAIVAGFDNPSVDLPNLDNPAVDMPNFKLYACLDCRKVFKVKVVEVKK